MLISAEGSDKNQLELGEESMGDAAVLSHCFAKKSMTKIDRCAGAFVKEKPAIGSPFFRMFPPDHIHKVAKDVFVHFFITIAIVVHRKKGNN